MKYIINSYNYFVRLIPESPRWLINNRKYNEAIKVLKYFANANKKILPSDDELIQLMKNIKQTVSGWVKWNSLSEQYNALIDSPLKRSKQLLPC